MARMRLWRLPSLSILLGCRSMTILSTSISVRARRSIPEWPSTPATRPEFWEPSRTALAPWETLKIAKAFDCSTRRVQPGVLQIGVFGVADVERSHLRLFPLDDPRVLAVLANKAPRWLAATGGVRPRQGRGLKG